MKPKQPEYQIDNLQPDIPDSRDYIFSGTASSEVLPSTVDHRSYAREIENQGRTGSCVANATVSALELLHKKSGQDINLSRLFLYYNLRKPYINLHGKDIGSYTRDGFKMSNQFGICQEKHWDFLESKVHTEPSEFAYKEALNHKVNKYERIPTTKDDDMIHFMKVALAKGYPILIGMKLGRTFYSMKNSLETQDYPGVQDDSIGGHAMNIVGYSNELGGFIVENSWGSSWGDKGFCLISYDVIKKDTGDVWVCTEFKGIQIKEELIVPEVEPLKVQGNIHVIKREKKDNKLISLENKTFTFDANDIKNVSGGKGPYRISAKYVFGDTYQNRLSVKDNKVKYIIKKGDSLFPGIQIVISDSSLKRERVVTYLVFKTFEEPKPEEPKPEPKPDKKCSLICKIKEIFKKIINIFR